VGKDSVRLNDIAASGSVSETRTKTGDIKEPTREEVEAAKTARETALKDSLVRDAVAKKKARDSAAKEAELRNSSSGDSSSRNPGSRDVVPGDSSAISRTTQPSIDQKELLRKAAMKDSLALVEVERTRIAGEAARKDSIALAEAEKTRIAGEIALKDSLALVSVERNRVAREKAIKDSVAAENAENGRLARESFLKDSIATANKAAAAKTAAAKTATNPVDNNPGAVKPAVLSAINRLFEKKTDKEFIASYGVKGSDGKTDTVVIRIPVEQATTVKNDSPIGRWDSNPRPLSDAGTARKDSSGNPGKLSTAPIATKAPAMVNSDCVNFATEYDVDKLRVRMMAENTADERVAAARKVFRTKCFTTRQVRALTELFTNDEGRYKFLDTAYPFVSDSQEFHKLAELLKEDYYVKRFNAMIRS
jgi:uncharacterized protein DUF4476